MEKNRIQRSFQIENNTLEVRNLMTVVPATALVSKIGSHALPADDGHSISAMSMQKQTTGNMVGRWSVGLNKLVIASAQGTFPIRKYSVLKNEYVNATTFAKLSEPLILNYNSKETVNITLIDRKGTEIQLVAGISSNTASQKMIRMTLKYESSIAYNGAYMKGTMQVTVKTQSPLLQIRIIQDSTPV